MKVHLILGTLFFCLNANAYASFNYNSNVEEAHGKIHHLLLNDADTKINDLKADSLSVGFYYYLRQYRESVELLITQDASKYKTYVKESRTLRQQLENISSNSPWKLYCIAEMNLFEGMIHAKFGQLNAAAANIRVTYKLLDKNLQTHPDFLPTLKSLGLLEAGIGTLPDVYRKMIGILGYRGTISSGYGKINKFLNTSDPGYKWIYREAAYMKMAVELYLMNDTRKAWSTIDKNSADHETNLLAAFFRSNTAMKCGKNDEAIRTLESRPKGPGYFPFHFMDYLLGSAKLFDLDPTADLHLKAFINGQKKGDYVKSAYHKLTWYYLLFPNDDLYSKYRNLTISHGNVSLEADKQALFEVLDGDRPDQGLLKTRCLFDGGYYSRAENVIRPMRERNFEIPEHVVEYNYRKGRVYQMQGDTALSMAFYLEAIKKGKGKDLRFYYVAYSAYYIGELYELRNDYGMAIKYFEKAIELGKSTNFKKSIEQKAKSALARIKG